MENKLINNTYFKIVKSIYKEDNNFIYSPLSLFIALSLLLEGSLESGKTEILKFLNCDLDLVRKINYELYKNNNYKNKLSEIKLSNSIWLKEKVKEEYLNIIKEYYYSDVFSLSPFEALEEKVIEWINANTNNFLKLTKDNYQIDKNISLLLINTVYFDNKWKTFFDEKNCYYDYFNNLEKVKYMRHLVDSFYYNNNNFEIVYDYFENGNKVGYLLPKRGKVEDYLLVDILEYPLIDIKLDISVPIFKYFNNFDLKESLKSLGIKEVFKGGLDNINPNLYVSSIRQDSGIEFSLNGVKGASVTSISIMRCMCEAKKEVIVKLNKPFIYYIFDKSDTIIFSGVINNIGGNNQ